MAALRLPVLPALGCPEGCGQCCGPVPVTASELSRVRAYVRQHGLTPGEKTGRCPLYDGQRCTVYPVRPLLCQVFGHTKGLPCPKGLGAPRLPDRAVLALLREQGKRDRWLHELASPAMVEAR